MIACHTISGDGLTATFLSFGASLRDLRLDGHDAPLVLGLEDPADYPAHSRYMGATAGRYANRIAAARFTLDGRTFRTDPNFLGRHTLHGGSAGTGKRDWELLDHEVDAIRFGLTLRDGEMGFPGEMRIEALFSCAPSATLRIEYRATTQAPTICNLAHHTYWRLDDTGDVSRHRLTVAADRYVAVDEDLIPTGVASVDGTCFDFRQGRALAGEGLLDHNLCLSSGREPLREIAALRSDASGIEMRVATTEPGLQVYDGAKLDIGVSGLGGRRYGAHAGVALEPQIWPDAPNHDDFPSAVLRPGETYRQTTTFSFSKG
ncbi:aldose epimerase family protein [Jannaschia aquimarina]|uniref:GalM protein n=1 Tax=Jannaschia aquimarina TaxID=935700 RepID=A0A0D1CIK7_9RHOB|nr:aldose epimerase family protein [Jannaschia aquimarina]KIT14567.1 Aldose 1-epimerase [Jannaschia aquimarina]SNT35100.1 aldose 1-epimerase [Jannaschia aquimarina]